MLIYETQKWGGFAVLYRVFCKCDLTGSVFPSVLPWSCVAASIAAIIKLDEYLEWQVFSSVHDDSLFDQTYALQIWATAVGFALVFRGNLAYGRFWEGRIHIAKFSSYMQDTALMCVCYDETNKNMNQYREWKQVRRSSKLSRTSACEGSEGEIAAWCVVVLVTCWQEILHLFSLLHALGMQCLRADDNLDNLNLFDPWEGYKQSLGTTVAHCLAAVWARFTLIRSATESANCSNRTSGHTEGLRLPRSNNTALPPMGTRNAAVSAVPNVSSAIASTTKAQLPVRSAAQARRYSISPGVRFELMQAALAADEEASEATGAGATVHQTDSNDSTPQKPATNDLSADVGDVSLNLVLEPETKRGGVGRSGKADNAASSHTDTAAEEARRAGGLRREQLSSTKSSQQIGVQRTSRTRGRVGENSRKVSRVAPAEVVSDPVLMSRQYDEQFHHPINSEQANKARITAATETFHRMDRNMNGQLCKGDLRRVLEEDREQHLAAGVAVERMNAKRAEEQALRDNSMNVPVPSSSADDDDDAVAAAAAAAAAALESSPRSPPGPKRMKKPMKLKQAGQKPSTDTENGKPELLISQSSTGPPAVRFAEAVSESLSEREVRKIALHAMQAMRVDVSLRTHAQAKLLLDWAGSVPFFRDNAPSEEAMSAISKEVTAQNYHEGENIITQGERGDFFYVLLSGEVDVLVDGRNVGHMTVPSSFGDKALEGDNLRKATIRASTGVTVARLSKESYHASIKLVVEAPEATAREFEGPKNHENAALEESIRMADNATALMTMTLPLEQRSTVQKRNLEEWVGTIAYFKINARTEQHRREIAKALQPVYFNDEQVVFQQGDIGDAFYCIMQGEVDIVVDGESVGTLGPGKCFGDRALEASLVEGGEPDRRAATIRASATPRSQNRSETDLEVLAKSASEHPLSVISGLTREERIALGGCETFNGSRVIVAQSWVTQAIVRRRNAGGLAVDPPVLATGVFRNFQCANDAYFQCKKIVDTPFPYPYAQSMMLMLCLYTLISPVMICQIVNSTPWAIATSFITVGIFVTMNEVARGLEEPFGSGDESNKIAVDALHMDFNENLWCLSQKSYQRDAWPSQTATSAYSRSKTDQHPIE